MLAFPDSRRENRHVLLSNLCIKVRSLATPRIDLHAGAELRLNVCQDHIGMFAASIFAIMTFATEAAKYIPFAARLFQQQDQFLFVADNYHEDLTSRSTRTR